MSKEKYYNKIKRFVYRKFDELEVFESDNGNNIYLRYKNEEDAKVRIEKNSGIVYYNYKFREKTLKLIPFEYTDFQIFLSRWVENTFQMKVKHTLMKYL